MKIIDQKALVAALIIACGNDANAMDDLTTPTSFAITAGAAVGGGEGAAACGVVGGTDAWGFSPSAVAAPVASSSTTTAGAAEVGGEGAGAGSVEGLVLASSRAARPCPSIFFQHFEKGAVLPTEEGTPEGYQLTFDYSKNVFTGMAFRFLFSPTICSESGSDAFSVGIAMAYGDSTTPGSIWVHDLDIKNGYGKESLVGFALRGAMRAMHEEIGPEWFNRFVVSATPSKRDLYETSGFEEADIRSDDGAADRAKFNCPHPDTLEWDYLAMSVLRTNIPRKPETFRARDFR